MEVGGHSVSTTKFCRRHDYAAPKPANISKVADVKQDPDTLSFAFLEHLLDAYYLHTPKDPKDLANLNMVNLAIVFPRNMEVTLLHYLSNLLLATKDKEDYLRST